MKKLLNICIILLSLCLLSLSACSNDDIPIDDVVGKHDVTFKINPQTIIDTYRYSTHLEYIIGNYNLYDAPGYNLRIKLLIYDKEGSLVSSSEQRLSSYRETTSFTINLSEGDYHALTICDLIDQSSQKEYWTYKNEEKLSTLELDGSKNKNLGSVGRIIGFKSKVFTLKTLAESFVYDLEPMGALIYSQFTDIHTNIQQYLYDKYEKNINVDYIILYTKNYPSSIRFNNIGNYDISFDTEDGHVYPLTAFFPDKESEDAFSDIMVVFPTPYMSFGVGAVDDNNYYWTIGEENTIFEIEPGYEYLAGMSLQARNLLLKRLQ